MNDIRNEVRRQILSLSGDELLVATAILLSLRMKGTGNVDKYGTVPADKSPLQAPNQSYALKMHYGIR